MTTSAVSASRSVTLPFPSSPHWAPTSTNPGISSPSLGRGGDPEVSTHYRDRGARDLPEPRHRSQADLLAELVQPEVGGDHDRALVLPALVDDRVELLEHPLGALLGAEVVQVEQVHLAEAAEQLGVGTSGIVLVCLLDVGEQSRHGVDRYRAPRLESRLRYEHRERGLAGTDVAEEPEPAAGIKVLLDASDELAHALKHVRVHVADRPAIERDPPKALRDSGADPPARRTTQPALATWTGTRDVRFLVKQPAAAVAEAIRAEAGDLGRVAHPLPSTAVVGASTVSSR